MLLMSGPVYAQGGDVPSPVEQFELAKNAFYYQDYNKVIELLDPILNPEPTLPSGEMVMQGREWLGASLWWNGDKVGFKQQFTKLLQADAGFELDSFYYPPEMVKEFEELKTALADLNIIKTDKPTKPRTRVIYEKTVQKRSAVVNWVPLGAGQFANGKNVKGGLFLAGELVCVGGNIGSWLYMYYNNPTGDARTTATWVMYGSLALLAGVYVWGVVDAYKDFVPERIIDEKRVEKPEESASMFHIVPFPVPGEGFGVGIGTTF